MESRLDLKAKNEMLGHVKDSKKEMKKQIEENKINRMKVNGNKIIIIGFTVITLIELYFVLGGKISEEFTSTFILYIMSFFVFFSVRYFVQMMSFSERLKNENQMIYKKYSGFSSMGSIKMISPFILSKKVIKGKISEELFLLFTKYRANIYLLIISFMKIILFITIIQINRLNG